MEKCSGMDDRNSVNGWGVQEGGEVPSVWAGRGSVLTLWEEVALAERRALIRSHLKTQQTRGDQFITKIHGRKWFDFSSIERSEPRRGGGWGGATYGFLGDDGELPGLEPLLGELPGRVSLRQRRPPPRLVRKSEPQNVPEEAEKEGERARTAATPPPRMTYLKCFSDAISAIDRSNFVTGG
jgi:hypothetical protein